MSTYSGYRCGECGGSTRVTDSRPTGDSLRRRRVCTHCGVRVTTYEVVSDGAGVALIRVPGQQQRLICDLISIGNDVYRAQVRAPRSPQCGFCHGYNDGTCPVCSGMGAVG